MIGFFRKHDKFCNCKIKIWISRWDFCLFCGGIYKSEPVLGQLKKGSHGISTSNNVSQTESE